MNNRAIAWNNAANWVSYIITWINIAMIFAGVASYFAEQHSVAAPFIALCSSVIINCTCFKQLKLHNFRHMWTDDSLWQAIGATGLTVAASLWLTDAANATKNTDLSHWETITAWLVPIVIAMAIALPLVVIVQHALRITANYGSTREP